MIPEYNIGDKAWFATFQTREKYITCDDCQGSGYLTVIMGNKSQVTVECRGCQSGYDLPSGRVKIYEPQAKVELVVIARVEIEIDRIEYRSNNMTLYPDRLFKTKEEAEEKAKDLGLEYLKEQMDRLKNLKHSNQRTWSWNAHYHRRQIKEAQRQLEYHTTKLETAKVMANKFRREGKKEVV